jgi:polysaccharide export outer membrane protein
MRAAFLLLVTMLSATACGLIYHSPTVNPVTGSSGKVRVIDMTAESLLVANRSPYQPRALPSVFNMTAGASGSRVGAGALPEPVFDPTIKPSGTLETRLPPEIQSPPYRIGVGDVLLLATPQSGSSVEQLSGLLAATNARQGYTVQDDGAIAIPNVGRVRLSGMTLEEAEAELFQRLVENQIDPTFSLEISEFNSKKVAIGGAVSSPGVVPVTLTPLYLDEALSQAGGITVPDQDYASVRIYRDGTLYQIPLNELYSSSLRRIQLLDGDSVFVDTAYELDLAESYFQQQIQLQQVRQSARSAALSELSAEINLRRAALSEARSNFQTRMELGAVDRDYVYLAGEVGSQARYALPFDNTAMLADALYDAGGGFNTTVADVRQIYVLRSSPDPREFGAVTAWQLNASNASNLTLATRFELRPGDVIFIAEQPVTRWNRTIQQILPSLNIAGRTSSLTSTN